MSTFGDVRGEMADKLAAAGLPATLDPAQLPPFVLVAPVTVTTPSGIGSWPVAVDVVICTPPPGDMAAVVWLESTLETVLRTLGPASADFGTYDPAGRDLPAYRVHYTRTAPNPDC